MNTLSVVIPVLDEVNHLGECLAPLLDQSDDIDRIVVVDNASTDETLRWPISRLFATAPSRALPVDDQAESEQRIRAAA